MSSMDPMKDDFRHGTEPSKELCFDRITSASSKHKVIIIDEADNTGNDVQAPPTGKY